MLYTLDDAGVFIEPAMAGYVDQVRGFFDTYGPEMLNDEDMQIAMERYGEITQNLEAAMAAVSENEQSSIVHNNDHNADRQQKMQNIQERISMPDPLVPG